MANTSTSTWTPIARLLRPQGRRGEILSEPLSDLDGLFSIEQPVWLSAPVPHPLPPAKSPADPSPDVALHIAEHWFPTGKNAGRVVLKLSGCDSISSAEFLAGRELLIPTADLPTLDADTFFVGDLVGCTLYDGPTPIGEVTDLHFATGPDGRTRLPDAAPLLAVALNPKTKPDPTEAEAEPTEAEAEPTLIPFVKAWLDNVDIPARRITMHLPPGLLDPEPQPQPQPPTS